MFTMKLMMLIETLIEGGNASFSEKWAVFSTDDNTFIMAPKTDEELPNEFVDELATLSAEYKVRVVWANGSNFVGMTNDEAGEFISEAFRPVADSFEGNLKLNVTRALLDLEVPAVSSDSVEGEGLVSFIEELYPIKNYRIKFSDTVVLSLGDTSDGADEAEVDSILLLCTGRPNRETIINQDDITDLIIALGRTNTVEEFLALI